jgi:PPOX class probable F420-dependent enzyme
VPIVTDIPETHQDLLDANFATIATIAPDGRPQVSEVWFLTEDGKVKISLNETRKKVRNLRQNPAVSVMILDLTNPLRYLELRGDATVEPDDDFAFADRVGAKYGADLRTFGPSDHKRVVVTVEPVAVVTWG